MQASSKFTFNEVSKYTPIILTQLAKAHVSFDTFKLVFTIDLSAYYDLDKQISEYLDFLEEISPQLKSELLNITITQLRHRLDLFSQDEDMILSFRKKRSNSFVLCEFCGEIGHFLFGTMTDNRASEWAQTFNSWKNETITNRDLIKNQTLLFESSLHYNKKTFKHIEDSFRTLQNDLKRFESSTNISISAINLKLDVQTLIQIAQLGIEKHARLYGQIRRTFIQRSYWKNDRSYH